MVLRAKAVRAFWGLLIWLFSAGALAGGIWINEYGSPAQGRAGAGAQAGTGDASSAFFNPATMSQLDRPDVLVSASVIVPTTEFDVDQAGFANGTGSGGDAAEATPGGSVFYAHPLNEHWSVGVSGLALTGASLEYDSGWAGRYQAIDSELLLAGLIPAVSYRINDRLSVGASVPVMYGDLTLKVAVPNPVSVITGAEGTAKITGDDVEVGFMLGVSYEVSDRTRLGLIYQSEFEMEFDGDVEINPPDFEVGVDTGLNLAPIVRLGLTHEFEDRLRGHVTLGWDGWSDLENVMLSTSSAGLAIPRNWHDTYHSAVGLEYDVSSRWSVQGGVAYDTSPTNRNDRTADMPLDEQIRFAFGAEYRRANGMIIAGSIVYADYGDARINSNRNPPFDGIVGEYDDNNIVFLTVSVNWQRGEKRR